jgi:hypothetical protein
MTDRMFITETTRSVTAEHKWPYRMLTERDPFGGCPALWELPQRGSPSSRPRAIQIGDGILTQRSRDEVARITQRLGGKVKP